MLKKILSTLLAFALLIGTIPFSAFDLKANAATNGTIGSCTWEINGTCLTISGNGSMNGYPYTIPWKNEIITEIIIEKGVTEICNEAFNFEGFDVDKIEIPNTVYQIGSGVFQNSNIQEIVLPSSVHTIGSYAFCGCEDLKYVWYNGNESNKRNIQIFNDNSPLRNAEWHFICSGLHSYISNCDNSCEECDWIRNVESDAHKWNEGVVIVNENCKETGIIEYTCNDCGATKNETISKNDNHIYSNWIQAKPPTCMEKGEETRVCSICEKTDNRDIMELFHNMSEWEVSNVATCEINGEYKRSCSNCSYEETHDIKSSGHIFGKWIIDEEATCRDEGNKYQECAVCGYKQHKTIPVIGDHTYDSNCDTDCNICDKTRDITHKYESYITRATTSNNGSIVKKCTICGKVASETIISYPKTIKLSTTEYEYNGKTKKPSVIIKDSKGNKLDYGTDYTYKRPSSSKKVGKYSIKITFKGNYSGTKTLTYKIIPEDTKITSLKAGSKKITVKWSKKTKYSTGYEIQYSPSSKFSSKYTKTIKITKDTTTSKTISKLKAKKKYYVRVRCYYGTKTKYYSDWSNKKSTTTKK